MMNRFARRAVLVCAIVAVVYVRLQLLRRRRRSGRPEKQLPPPPETEKAVKATKRKGPVAGPLTRFVEKSAALNLAGEGSEYFPRKFEVHGHAVVLRLNSGITEEQFMPAAACFADSFSPIEINVVLVDTAGIAGELRRPQLDTLWCNSAAAIAYTSKLRRTITKRWRDNQAAVGPSSPMCVAKMQSLDELLSRYAESNTFTVHVENGVHYSMDVRSVMFSSGNTTERMHFAEVRAPGEVVVDMFAGIGYFTLPLAMHSGAAVVHALEKNPDSVAFLRLNAALNRVAHIVRPQCGDNREVGSELIDSCDRVLMGYIPSCKEFLPRAVQFLKGSGRGEPHGFIHYHLLADRADAEATMRHHCEEMLGTELSAKIVMVNLRRVKSYAPKQFHFVADLQL